MPGTLDRRHSRDRKAPFDAAKLMRAAVDLSRSCQEEKASEVDLSAECFSSVSSDVIETDADNSSSNASNLAASSEVVSRHCQQERTPPIESTDTPATDGVDVRDGELSKVDSVSAAAVDDQTPTRTVVGRRRRSRSDEAETARCRRKQFVGQDVGLGRRCRSLERRPGPEHLRCDAVTSSGVGDGNADPSCGAAVRKSDSFDSGIDTKSESTSPRTGGSDDVVDGGGNSPPDVISPPSTRCDATPEVLSLTPAEVEYDRKAATLVRSLGDDNADLRRVLTSLVTYRVPTCYVCGVFDNVVRPLCSDLADADRPTELSVSDDGSTSTDHLKVRPLL